MSDFNLVEPRGWEYDLQSIYSAYMGHFQLHNIPWYERSWGVFFETFEEFLTFSWPVITVTDCWTGKAHIVTRMTTIGAFLKMIKTRFGETLPLVDNIQRVTPFETAHRHMRTISDYSLYKKLYSTLPAAVLASLKIRVRDGEVRAIRDLWQQHDKTFLGLDFEWSERNASTCLEWGYAAARCNHLDAVGVWPPDPEVNYRRGHYIVTEYADKQHNKHRPNYPWAFGDSLLATRQKLPQIIQAVIRQATPPHRLRTSAHLTRYSSMTSPDSETIPNSLVLVGHGIGSNLRRMEEMKIKIPHNVLIIDTASLERQLFASNARGAMHDSSGKPRVPGSALSLPALLQSLPSPPALDMHLLHNAGNTAFMALLALQTLLEPMPTKGPAMRGRAVQQALMRNGSRNPLQHQHQQMLTPVPVPMPMYAMNVGMGMPLGTPVAFPPVSPISPAHTPSRSPKPLQDSDVAAGGGGRRSTSSGSYFPSVQDPGRPRKASGLVPPEARGGGGGGGSGGGGGGGAGTPRSRQSSMGVEEVAERMGNVRM
ncbi:hypothetical protein BDW22DRAFT_1328838 [Trametopsis cervina]|nr:hypothetical protein BDW22DRAFT_1328838 [Trametopsis cervina]